MTTLLDLLYGGGLGSGCHGPNCGRPRVGSRTRTVRLLQRKYAGQLSKRSARPAGVIRKGGKEMILVQPVSKGRSKLQFQTPEGHRITILKPLQQIERTGVSWLRKVSPVKGEFKRDVGFPKDIRALTGQNVQTGFYMARKPGVVGAGVGVAVVKNFGELRATVHEYDLGEHGAIARRREVVFNNLGRAYGFLNHRYGIRMKFK